MNMRNVVCTAVALVGLPLAAIAAAAGGASAATVSQSSPVAIAPVPLGKALSPAYCNHDVCARAYQIAGARLVATIALRVWAPSRTFHGHFELLMPGQPPINSSDATNPAGGLGAVFEIPNDDGAYNARSWQQTGPRSWADIGSAGFRGGFSG